MAEWQNPVFFAIVLAVAIVFVIVLVSSIVLFTRIYFKRIIEEKEKLTKAKEEHQRSLLRNSVLIQERERERIAKELHDGLVSKLTVIAIAMQTNNQRVNPIELLVDSIKMARGISHDLLPPLLEQQTLSELIEAFAAPLAQTYQLSFIWGKHKQNPILETEIKLQMFRIVQEVINNVIKHAQATKLEIYLRPTEKFTSIRISDNGIGFNVNNGTKGLGFKNIELRSQLINANYKFKTKPGKGSTFVLIMLNNPIQLSTTWKTTVKKSSSSSSTMKR
jgi:signal transduction histidine kinase